MKTADEVPNMFIEGVRCIGGRRSVVYVTVAISSGYRLFQLLDELGCSYEMVKEQHHERFLAEVFRPNMLDAESWAEQARNSFRGRVVLDPSRLVVPGWTQDQYNDLWDSVIDEFVDVVVATPRWAFSRGARKEIEKAIRTGRRVVDLTGIEISAPELLQQDERARDELRSWGWSAQRIDGALPALDIERKGDEQAPPPVNHWEEAFSWVHRDLSDYVRISNIYTPTGDDQRTRLGLLHNDGWGPRKMERYWNMVLERSISTNVGRVELGSLVGAGVGMLRSVWRVSGPMTGHLDMRQAGWRQRLLAPARPGERQLSQYLSQVETDVWSWIQFEHAEMRLDHTIGSDDERTRELAAGDPGAWTGELWREYWDYAVHHSLESQEGKYYLGKFVTCAFRIFESAVRLYGEPRRLQRDLTRDPDALTHPTGP